ncbi:hypothetical protein H9P43_001209 [Blastocladiella emersonii ATCC 22665]|nr:hypothetical protein H9P43_001209 [Blastocladiella emersonii ATCC 22665]
MSSALPSAPPVTERSPLLAAEVVPRHSRHPLPQPAADHAHDRDDATPPSPIDRSKAHSYLGAVLLVVCLVSFVVQSEITSHIQNQISFKRPYFILWFSHSCYAVLLPLQALFALASDGSLRPTLRYLRTAITTLHPAVARSRRTHHHHHHQQQQQQQQPAATRIPFVLRMLLVAFGSAFPSYCWYGAVSMTSMTSVTAIYNTSSFFAYVFSVLFAVDGERFAFRKMAAVSLSLVGIAVIAAGTAPVPPEEGVAAVVPAATLAGDAMALLGAATYGLYEALYKKYAVPPRPTVAFANFITGMIGVMTLLVLWIPIPLLDAAGVEPFALPTREQFGALAAIALMGLMFNASFMLVIAFTSPVMAAVGIMLTIPCIALADLALGTVASIPLATGIGSLLICIGFVVLSTS